MIESYMELARRILARPARLGRTRLVAIDGPSGAGKTRFAAQLAAALADLTPGGEVPVVHTDDLLDGWSDQFTFWPRLAQWVLDPLSARRAGRYRCYDWRAGRFGDAWIEVPPAPVVLLEGVSSARAAIRPKLSYSVFVTAPASVRRARVLARDGAALRPFLEAWWRGEESYFPADRTHDHVDLVVDGSVPAVDGFRRLTGPGQRSTHGIAIGNTISGMTTPAFTESDLRAAVERELPGVRADLERLVRIPGIAFDGFDHSHVERSAEAVAELLRGCGLDVRIVRSGGQPAVIGKRPAPPGAPTVLLYAHHDVQPVGDRALWDSDPFEPVERDGRLYGRGAADDKAGIMAHVAALRAFGDALPVGVVLFIEGEEEYGSDSLERLLNEHRDEIAADVIVIADSANWDIGVPALTTSLRGIVNCFVEVRTLAQAVHSGMFGGAVPDALTTLVRLLATLHDEAGDVAVDGLVRRDGATVDYPEERLRTEAGMIGGVSFIGTGRLTDRIWYKPAISVLGIDAPRTAEAPNALVPSAKAKLSVRLAPGDDPKRAFAALTAHLAKHVPWGAALTVTLEHDGAPCVINASGPMFDAARSAFRAAWDGVEPVDVGIGGSIPFIATFQEMFPQAAILVTGVEDPHSAAHGPNESLHLGEFARACLAETLLFAKVAQAARATTR